MKFIGCKRIVQIKKSPLLEQVYNLSANLNNYIIYKQFVTQEDIMSVEVE